MIIAIDGPAGSGKSTTAREVAKRTGSLYIDTGAMYRAIALYCLETDTDVESDKLGLKLEKIDVELVSDERGEMVLLNGINVTERLRTRQVSDHSSLVSRRKDVRQKMVELQRKMAERTVHLGGSVVMEGRDIGTVVFPKADYKFFLVAEPEIRAQRRVEDLRILGVDADVDTVLREIQERDARDASRDISPLRKADDAYQIDTSYLSFEEQVDNILTRIRGNET